MDNSEDPKLKEIKIVDGYGYVLDGNRIIRLAI